MKFKDAMHKKAYEQLIEEMYLSDEESQYPSQLLKRQLAFVYLIALHQEAYKQFEGEAFYIEVGEELSIGGPTYLMEEAMGDRQYDHEKMLQLASQILKGENPCITRCPAEDVIYLQEAINSLQL